MVVGGVGLRALLEKGPCANRTGREDSLRIAAGCEYGGRLVPFGASISYKPAAKMETSAALEFDCRVREGILPRYHLHSGGDGSGITW